MKLPKRDALPPPMQYRNPMWQRIQSDITRARWRRKWSVRVWFFGICGFGAWLGWVYVGWLMPYK